MEIRLPTRTGQLEVFRLGEPRAIPSRPSGAFNRVAFAAAHVVADPLGTRDPWLDCAIDWEATLQFRRHLWSLGLGVAEAMDTAQRGMGLDWPSSLELIRRTVAAASDVPGALLASGAGTDQLPPRPGLTLDEVIAAYEEQFEAIESLGGRIIMMASRALAACATGPDDYYRVYARLLRQARAPVILHWLGEMFDPALAGYWGSPDPHAAMEVCLAVVAEHAPKVDGIKISLLSKESEIEMRHRLPAGVRMYTGDDFNYAELIEGDEHGHSDALLGIFDAIAPVAAEALAALGRGDRENFRARLAPTLPPARHLFGAPTRFYKTGLVFLAWLNGHQNHFTMVGGQQSARSIVHLAEAFRLADRAGLLCDPETACQRMRTLLAQHGLAT
ncbi:MAG TPA: dihydrodipicolinate synthase family protein [Myxococcaceae bacterium]|nr:dihydrodipicolinate synthase family protein [Myxococcaceae bacterium]